MPPLLLDDDEAVAVAVGLRAAATGAVAGMAEASLGALAKLEQVLPARLRARVSGLQSIITPVPFASPGPVVDPDVLTAVAAACRASERLRFSYTSHDGSVSDREAEPTSWELGAALVPGRFDIGRNDWRTFRVDRVTPRTPSACGSRRARCPRPTSPTG